MISNKGAKMTLRERTVFSTNDSGKTGERSWALILPHTQNYPKME